MSEDFDYGKYTPTADKSEDSLARVSRLAEELLERERLLAEAEELVKSRKEAVRQIAENELPELLEDLGLQDGVRTTSGYIVGFKRHLNASITEERREAAHNWLENNGLGGIIKRLVSVSLGRDEQLAADNAKKALQEAGLMPAEKQWVEPATLKAQVKQLMDAGTVVPEDIFGIFIKKVATVKVK